MEMSAELLFVIGLVASAVVWLLKVALKGREYPAWVLTTGVYVVSFILALAFAAPKLPGFPPFNDAASFMNALVAYLGLLLPLLAAAVGFATIIYQALLKRILDGLGNKIKSAIG